MFILENPVQILPKLLEKIKEFGDLPGFYINKNELKVLCKNVTEKKQEEKQSYRMCNSQEN